jgi:hypothetical protein
MKSLNVFAREHPLGFVAAVEGGIVLVGLFTLAVQNIFAMQAAAPQAVLFLLLTLATVALVQLMGWWQRIGYVPVEQSGDLYYYAVPLLPALINLIGVIVAGGFVFGIGPILEAVLVSAMVAFVLETLFRGVILTALRDRDPWVVALVTAVLFSFTLWFASVIFGTSQDTGVILLQLPVEFAIGFAFAAVVLRKRVLWPLVIATFLTQFFGALGATPTVAVADVLISLALVIIFVAYGAWLLLYDRSARKPAGY